uniref:hypothetical protein n=1 Tax=Streptomyces calvus TaxID=67282 RepID=UPI003514FE06
MSTHTELQASGGVTQALVAALDQIHSAITARMVGPDGKPSGTAVYMHLPVGYPIDPTMYSFPWTPAGGSTSAAVTSDGRFAPATPAPEPAAAATTPAAALAAVPPKPDPQLQHSLQAAAFTSNLVDEMLMVTKNGIAVAWPNRKVSFAYKTALVGMQAEEVPPPSPEIQARIDSAKKTLFTFDADGNMTGYSRKYEIYNKNRKAYEDAVSDFANAFAAATTDPVQGQSWPVTSAKYKGAVDRARADLFAMGGQEVEDAIATTQSIGSSAAASFIAQAPHVVRLLPAGARRCRRGQCAVLLHRSLLLVGPEEQGLRHRGGPCGVQSAHLGHGGRKHLLRTEFLRQQLLLDLRQCRLRHRLLRCLRQRLAREEQRSLRHAHRQRLLVQLP